MSKSRGVEVLNRLLVNVLDALPYPFYIIDAETYTIVFANRAAGEGIVPGKSTCYQVSYHRDRPCDDPEHPCPLTRVLTTGEPTVVEHVHYDAQGRQWIMEVHAYPVRADDGSIPYIVEAAVDITERHRAQEEARRHEAELSATLDAAPVLMMTVDKERRIRRANRAVSEFLGLPATDLSGRRFGNAFHCVHANDDPRGCGFGPQCGACTVRRLVFDTLHKGQPFYQREVTLRLTRSPAPQTYTFWATSVPLPNDHPLALLVLEDITPLKNALARAQRLLSYQETLHDILTSAAHAQDLLTLLETVLDMILRTTGVAAGAVWVGEAYAVRGVDPSIAEICSQAGKEVGLCLEEPIAIADVMHDTIPPPLDKWASRVMEPFRLRALLGVPIIAGDKCMGGIGVACFEPVRWREEDIVLLTTVGQEVGALAERLMLIERLQRVNADLQEALQMREQMLQNVSHELRTPLTIIRGYTDLMQERALGDLSSEQEEALTVMQRNIERLLFMINRLLLMRSIREEPIVREPLHLERWLQALVQEWHPVAEEKDFILHLDIASSLPPVTADPQLLRQVMDNLIHNAMKFSPKGSTISIAAYPEGDHVIIAVSDKGVGIPPDRLEKVFDPFYQVDGGLSRRFEGLGIGLTLCKQIIELHGGRIWAESEGEGKGTTFYGALPVE